MVLIQLGICMERKKNHESHQLPHTVHKMDYRQKYKSLKYKYAGNMCFSCLMALTRMSSTTLNISGESGHSCIFPDLRGKLFSFSPSSTMLAMNLS